MKITSNMSKTKILETYEYMTEEEISNMTIAECNLVYESLEDDFYTDNLYSF